MAKAIILISSVLSVVCLFLGDKAGATYLLLSSYILWDLYKDED